MIVKDFNRRIPTSTAIAIVLFLAILVGGLAFWQYSKIEEETAGIARIKLPKKIEFPIDNKAEAVFYAKRNSEVKSFIEEWSKKGYESHFWASFDEDDSLWAVGISPIGIKDIWFEIHFKPDGTITQKGQGEGV